MQNLGAALGWKYNHKPGIRTKGDKIIGWPKSLGTKPAKAEQAIIIAEYKTYLTASQPLTIEDKIALIDDSASLPDLKEAIKKIMF